jgi:hypothetical protein
MPERLYHLQRRVYAFGPKPTQVELRLSMLLFGRATHTHTS